MRRSGGGALLSLLLLVAPQRGARGDCDMNGLCRRLVKIAAQDAALCAAREDCLRPARPDCMNDEELSNGFSCDATDCLVIQSMASSVAECAAQFPRTKGTNMEMHSESDPENEFKADVLVQDKPSAEGPIERDGLLIFNSPKRPFGDAEKKSPYEKRLRR